jgi:hypothetical protein
MSSLEGILDEDYAVIDAMNSNAFAPMVLPVLFVLLPLIASVLTGISLNFAFPRDLPGQWGWSNLAIWYPLEAYYVIKKWKETARKSWLSLTYWVGKRFWSNEFLVIDWRLLGKIDETTLAVTATQEQIQKGQNKPGTPLLPPAPAAPAAAPAAAAQVTIQQVPEKLKTYKYVVEFLLKSESFPKLWVCMNDLPERELSFVGNSGMVLNGGLLFQTDHIASASFVRTDFYEDELHKFIPIGIFNSNSLIAQNIFDSSKPDLPTKEAIAAVAPVADTHRAGFYYRKWQDSEAINKNWEKENQDLDVRIDNRSAATVREARKAGQIPIGPGMEPPPKKGHKLPGTRGQWTMLVITVAVIALIVWRLA